MTMISWIGPADDLHANRKAATYRALEASRPPPDELKGRGKIDPAFRQTVAADSNSFLEQLPFYSVKPLYPELMAAVHRAGLSLVASGLAVSAAVYFGI